MALRDQPYIPLYIQDFLTDEKLMECSASATGIYIRIMCVLHKQNEYGVILLKQKYKQNDKQLLNFASQLARFLPYDKNEIFEGLNELVNEGVLCLEDDKLFQKRMVKDNKLSIIRANSGSKGGKKTQFAKAKSKAKVEANTEYENENEDVNKDSNNKYNIYISTINKILNTNFRLTDKIKPKIAKILKEFTIQEIELAVKNAKKDSFHAENNFKYLTSEFFTRSDKVEAWLNSKGATQGNNQTLSGNILKNEK